MRKNSILFTNLAGPNHMRQKYNFTIAQQDQCAPFPVNTTISVLIIILMSSIIDMFSK